MRTRSGLTALTIGAVLALVACDQTATLVIDVRTDFDPGYEFGIVRVSIDDHGGPAIQRIVRTDEDFLDGQRVAELELTPGTYVVRVGLLTAAGNLVTERPVSVRVESAHVITVVIARSCADVSCGGDGRACHGGRCVDDSCVTENLAACGVPECDVPADCPAGSLCAERVCAAGSCLLGAGACPGGGLCSRIDGCPPVGVDAGLEDAGPSDAGPMCGDLSCQAGETCSSCPTDCGSCPSCGDGSCNGSEATCIDCASDCRHGHMDRADMNEPCSADEFLLHRCVTMNDGPCAGALVSQRCSVPPPGARVWAILACAPSDCGRCFCEDESGCF